MRIAYEDYTGLPSFTDFTIMVWREMCKDDWRWPLLIGITDRQVAPLPKIKLPTDFDANSIKSLLDVHNLLKPHKTKQEAEEKKKFIRFFKDRINQKEKREIIAEYIKRTVGLTYQPKSPSHRKVYNLLRQRLK